MMVPEPVKPPVLAIMVPQPMTLEAQPAVFISLMLLIHDGNPYLLLFQRMLQLATRARH